MMKKNKMLFIGLLMLITGFWVATIPALSASNCKTNGDACADCCQPFTWYGGKCDCDIGYFDPQSFGDTGRMGTQHGVILSSITLPMDNECDSKGNNELCKGGACCEGVCVPGITSCKTDSSCEGLVIDETPCANNTNSFCCHGKCVTVPDGKPKACYTIPVLDPNNQRQFRYRIKYALHPDSDPVSMGHIWHHSRYFTGPDQSVYERRSKYVSTKKLDGHCKWVAAGHGVYRLKLDPGQYCLFEQVREIRRNSAPGCHYEQCSLRNEVLKPLGWGKAQYSVKDVNQNYKMIDISEPCFNLANDNRTVEVDQTAKNIGSRDEEICALRHIWKHTGYDEYRWGGLESEKHYANMPDTFYTVQKIELDENEELRYTFNSPTPIGGHYGFGPIFYDASSLRTCSFTNETFINNRAKLRISYERHTTPKLSGREADAMSINPVSNYFSPQVDFRVRFFIQADGTESHQPIYRLWYHNEDTDSIYFDERYQVPNVMSPGDEDEKNFTKPGVDYYSVTGKNIINVEIYSEDGEFCEQSYLTCWDGVYPWYEHTTLEIEIPEILILDDTHPQCTRVTADLGASLMVAYDVTVKKNNVITIPVTVQNPLTVAETFDLNIDIPDALNAMGIRFKNNDGAEITSINVPAAHPFNDVVGNKTFLLEIDMRNVTLDCHSVWDLYANRVLKLEATSRRYPTSLYQHAKVELFNLLPVQNAGKKCTAPKGCLFRFNDESEKGWRFLQCCERDETAAIHKFPNNVQCRQYCDENTELDNDTICIDSNDNDDPAQVDFLAKRGECFNPWARCNTNGTIGGMCVPTKQGEWECRNENDWGIYDKYIKGKFYDVIDDVIKPAMNMCMHEEGFTPCFGASTCPGTVEYINVSLGRKEVSCIHEKQKQAFVRGVWDDTKPVMKRIRETCGVLDDMKKPFSFTGFYSDRFIACRERFVEQVVRGEPYNNFLYDLLYAFKNRTVDIIIAGKKLEKDQARVTGGLTILPDDIIVDKKTQIYGMAENRPLWGGIFNYTDVRNPGNAERIIIDYTVDTIPQRYLVKEKYVLLVVLVKRYRSDKIVYQVEKWVDVRNGTFSLEMNKTKILNDVYITDGTDDGGVGIFNVESYLFDLNRIDCNGHIFQEKSYIHRPPIEWGTWEDYDVTFAVSCADNEQGDNSEPVAVFGAKTNSDWGATTQSCYIKCLEGPMCKPGEFYDGRMVQDIIQTIERDGDCRKKVIPGHPAPTMPKMKISLIERCDNDDCTDVTVFCGPTSKVCDNLPQQASADDIAKCRQKDHSCDKLTNLEVHPNTRYRIDFEFYDGNSSKADVVVGFFQPGAEFQCMSLDSYRATTDPVRTGCQLPEGASYLTVTKTCSENATILQDRGILTLRAYDLPLNSKFSVMMKTGNDAKDIPMAYWVAKGTQCSPFTYSNIKFTSALRPSVALFSVVNKNTGEEIPCNKADVRCNNIEIDWNTPLRLKFLITPATVPREGGFFVSTNYLGTIKALKPSIDGPDEAQKYSEFKYKPFQDKSQYHELFDPCTQYQSLSPFTFTEAAEKITIDSTDPTNPFDSLYMGWDMPASVEKDDIQWIDVDVDVSSPTPTELWYYAVSATTCGISNESVVTDGPYRLDVDFFQKSHIELLAIKDEDGMTACDSIATCDNVELKSLKNYYMYAVVNRLGGEPTQLGISLELNDTSIGTVHCISQSAKTMKNQCSMAAKGEAVKQILTPGVDTQYYVIGFKTTGNPGILNFKLDKMMSGAIKAGIEFSSKVGISCGGSTPVWCEAKQMCVSGCGDAQCKVRCGGVKSESSCINVCNSLLGGKNCNSVCNGVVSPSRCESVCEDQDWVPLYACPVTSEHFSCQCGGGKVCIDQDSDLVCVPSSTATTGCPGCSPDNCKLDLVCTSNDKPLTEKTDGYTDRECTDGCIQQCRQDSASSFMSYVYVKENGESKCSCSCSDCPLGLSCNNGKCGKYKARCPSTTPLWCDYKDKCVKDCSTNLINCVNQDSCECNRGVWCKLTNECYASHLQCVSFEQTKEFDNIDFTIPFTAEHGRMLSLGSSEVKTFTITIDNNDTDAGFFCVGADSVTAPRECGFAGFNCRVWDWFHFDPIPVRVNGGSKGKVEVDVVVPAVRYYAPAGMYTIKLSVKKYEQSIVSCGDVLPPLYTFALFKMNVSTGKGEGPDDSCIADTDCGYLNKCGFITEQGVKLSKLLFLGRCGSNTCDYASEAVTCGAGKICRMDNDGINKCLPTIYDITDTDGDGVLDTYEEEGCIDKPDCDGDGVRDGDDPNDHSSDSDGDGVLDGEEELGCLLSPDCDGDGLGDKDDTDDYNIDTDGDGIIDGCDEDHTKSNLPATPPEDTDNDQVPDSCEEDGCIDLIDCDGDGLLDSEDPNDHNIDSDGDGVIDGREEKGCTLSKDCDGDGLSDDLDPNDHNSDSDGDGIIDGAEILSCVLSADCDGDGIPDREDTEISPNIQLMAPLEKGFYRGEKYPISVFLSNSKGMLLSETFDVEAIFDDVARIPMTINDALEYRAILEIPSYANLGQNFIAINVSRNVFHRSISKDVILYDVLDLSNVVITPAVVDYGSSTHIDFDVKDSTGHLNKSDYRVELYINGGEIPLSIDNRFIPPAPGDLSVELCVFGPYHKAHGTCDKNGKCCIMRTIDVQNSNIIVSGQVSGIGDEFRITETLTVLVGGEEGLVSCNFDDLSKSCTISPGSDSCEITDVSFTSVGMKTITCTTASSKEINTQIRIKSQIMSVEFSSDLASLHPGDSIKISKVIDELGNEVEAFRADWTITNVDTGASLTYTGVEGKIPPISGTFEAELLVSAEPDYIDFLKTYTLAVESYHGIELILAAKESYGKLDKDNTYVVTINNKGTQDETLQLEISCDQCKSAKMSKSTVLIPANGTIDVEYTMTFDKEGTVPYKISAKNAFIVDFVQGSITVSNDDIYDLAMSFVPEGKSMYAVEKGSNVKIDVKVSNIGTVDTPFDIFVQGSEDKAEVLSIKAGEYKIIPFSFIAEDDLTLTIVGRVTNKKEISKEITAKIKIVKHKFSVTPETISLLSAYNEKAEFTFEIFNEGTEDEPFEVVPGDIEGLEILKLVTIESGKSALIKGLITVTKEDNFNIKIFSQLKKEDVKTVIVESKLKGKFLVELRPLSLSLEKGHSGKLTLKLFNKDSKGQTLKVNIITSDASVTVTGEKSESEVALIANGEREISYDVKASSKGEKTVTFSVSDEQDNKIEVRAILKVSEGGAIVEKLQSELKSIEQQIQKYEKEIVELESEGITPVSAKVALQKAQRAHNKAKINFKIASYKNTENFIGESKEQLGIVKEEIMKAVHLRTMSMERTSKMPFVLPALLVVFIVLGIVFVKMKKDNVKGSAKKRAYQNQQYRRK